MCIERPDLSDIVLRALASARTMVRIMADKDQIINRLRAECARRGVTVTAQLAYIPAQGAQWRVYFTRVWLTGAQGAQLAAFDVFSECDSHNRAQLREHDGAQLRLIDIANDAARACAGVAWMCAQAQ